MRAARERSGFKHPMEEADAMMPIGRSSRFEPRPMRGALSRKMHESRWHETIHISILLGVRT